MKLKRITNIIIGIVIFIVAGSLTLGILIEKFPMKKEKENSIDALYLPKTATEIENHGNGWVTFRLKNKEIIYFRHPFSHETAITSSP
ncbi:hypothetical protein L6248_00530 [Candidatus Parcubacteria bacterium]|nr:hypothetical protein [Candidatus Parcubacteria bacterium]